MACLRFVRNCSSSFNIIHEMILVFLVLILRFKVYHFADVSQGLNLGALLKTYLLCRNVLGLHSRWDWCVRKYPSYPKHLVSLPVLCESKWCRRISFLIPVYLPFLYPRRMFIWLSFQTLILRILFQTKMTFIVQHINWVRNAFVQVIGWVLLCTTKNRICLSCMITTYNSWLQKDKVICLIKTY
jgi:hypothetical protein